jgi:hypothetical protein
MTNATQSIPAQHAAHDARLAFRSPRGFKQRSAPPAAPRSRWRPLPIALTFSMQFVEAKSSLVEVNVRWTNRHALKMIFNNISFLLGKSAS